MGPSGCVVGCVCVVVVCVGESMLKCHPAAALQAQARLLRASGEPPNPHLYIHQALSEASRRESSMDRSERQVCSPLERKVSSGVLYSKVCGRYSKSGGKV